jgi:uncharacterized protein (TIGR00299 family) protein
MHLHLNPLGGLAGDMFCAALLHAFPDQLDRVREQLASLDSPLGLQVELQAQAGLIAGKRFRVSAQLPADHPHHSCYADIRQMLDRAPLRPGTTQWAQQIFRLLAAAEAEVHGVTIDQVSFHEVGAWDSIADIVSAAALLDALGVDSASCDPLPLGGGRVSSAHGFLPVPAPATAILLHDLPLVDDGISGERVTPTGAAILQCLQPARMRTKGMVLATGYGFGSRTLEGVANCLQIVCLDTATGPAADTGCVPQPDRVALLRFEVDDQMPEDLAQGLDNLRALPAVLSVTCVSGIGKRGRPTMCVEVLAQTEALQQVARACFTETSSIGLRWQYTDRLILSRHQRQVVSDQGSFSVKLVERPNGADAKVESAELRQIAGQGQRNRLRHRLAEQALKEADDA